MTLPPAVVLGGPARRRRALDEPMGYHHRPMRHHSSLGAFVLVATSLSLAHDVALADQPIRTGVG